MTATKLFLERICGAAARGVVQANVASTTTTTHRRLLLGPRPLLLGVGGGGLRWLTTTRTKSSSAETPPPPPPPSSDSTDNLINLNKTRRLMRLIYSRVHPDLFTNYLHAQKQNENSLKILRNLLDLYAAQSTGPTRFFGSNLQDELVFYVKDAAQASKLRKVSVKMLNSSGSGSSPYTASSAFSLHNNVERRVESVLNQFIEHLQLPVRKFDSVSLSENESAKSSYSYKITYQRARAETGAADPHYDDEYIDYDDFERWASENADRNKVPDLRDWIKENRASIEAKQQEARAVSAQIEETKRAIIKQWKLKDIRVETNWSLKHFSSYLLALKSVNAPNTHFEGFTLVLTNNRPGLRKNGHIYLSCAQVYEEWLNVLAVSKANAKLIEDIHHMELFLSRLLKNIRICDALDNTSLANSCVDESKMSSASYYYQLLNVLLNHLTSHLEDNKDMDKLLNQTDFSHLQLTIQNVNTLQLNEAGQFIIGTSNRVHYDETVEFILKNQATAVQLHNRYVRGVATLRETQERLKRRLANGARIEFDAGLGYEQKLSALTTLLDGRHESVLASLSELKGLALTVGTTFKLNENGTIEIPWNWFTTTASD